MPTVGILALTTIALACAVLVVLAAWSLGLFGGRLSTPLLESSRGREWPRSREQIKAGLEVLAMSPPPSGQEGSSGHESYGMRCYSPSGIERQNCPFCFSQVNARSIKSLNQSETENAISGLVRAANEGSTSACPWCGTLLRADIIRTILSAVAQRSSSPARSESARNKRGWLRRLFGGS